MRLATATVTERGERYIIYVHEVRDYDGNLVATRRSERLYGYAICRRVTGENGPTVAVERWSQSAKCSGSYFALPVTHAWEEDR